MAVESGEFAALRAVVWIFIRQSLVVFGDLRALALELLCGGLGQAFQKYAL